MQFLDLWEGEEDEAEDAERHSWISVYPVHILKTLNLAWAPAAVMRVRIKYTQNQDFSPHMERNMLVIVNHIDIISV